MSCPDHNERAHKRVTGIVNGEVVPISDNPLLTSASTPWSGFLLEAHTATTLHLDVWWRWHTDQVWLITEGSVSFCTRPAGHNEPSIGRERDVFVFPTDSVRAGENQGFQGCAGSVFVWPAGFDGARFTHAASNFQLICVELDPRSVSTVLKRHDMSPADALLPQVAVRDLAIERLLRSMADEVAAGCPSGSLYGQSLSLALTTYLEGRFSTDHLARATCEGKLSDQHVRQIVDYIAKTMESEFDLHELSTSLSISPRHFFRLFSNTFGATPHKYIMKLRVDRAKSLLLAGHSIANVAQELGFASQSHFTSVFRKIAGAPPGKFRAEELNLSNARAHAQKPES